MPDRVQTLAAKPPLRVYGGRSGHESARLRRIRRATREGAVLAPRNRHFRLALTPIAIGLLSAAVFASGAAALPRSKSPAANTKQKHHRLTATERSRIRKQLASRLKRNPTVALSRAFMKQAAAVEFRLPLTARLRNSDGQGGYLPADDQLEIDWDDSAFVWPLDPGIPPAPQTVLLSGGFTMESVYNGGDTTGYGELGANEVVLGGAIDMTSDPFTISDFFGGCPDGPQLTTAPDAQVAISSAGPRYGVMNPFSQAIRGTLNLRMSFAAARRPDCASAAFATDSVDNSAALPMPLRFNGKLSVSPGITADGKLRFGKITIDDSVTPQLTTFAFVRSCTGPLGNCDPKSFPARLKLKKLTAEVLLGDVFPAVG